MKLSKKLLSILLCAVMVLGSVAVGGEGVADLIAMFSIKASASYNSDALSYSVYAYSGKALKGVPYADVTLYLGSKEIFSKKTDGYGKVSFTAKDILKYSDYVDQFTVVAKKEVSSHIYMLSDYNNGEKIKSGKIILDKKQLRVKLSLAVTQELWDASDGEEVCNEFMQEMFTTTNGRIYIYDMDFHKYSNENDVTNSGCNILVYEDNGASQAHVGGFWFGDHSGHIYISKAYNGGFSSAVMIHEALHYLISAKDEYVCGYEIVNNSYDLDFNKNGYTEKFDEENDESYLIGWSDRSISNGNAKLITDKTYINKYIDQNYSSINSYFVKKYGTGKTKDEIKKGYFYSVIDAIDIDFCFRKICFDNNGAYFCNGEDFENLEWGYFKRPSTFGIMESDYDNVRLSTSDDYNYTNSYNFSQKEKNPEVYTAHYYQYGQSVSDHLDSFLNLSINMAGFDDITENGIAYARCNTFSFETEDHCSDENWNFQNCQKTDIKICDLSISSDSNGIRVSIESGSNVEAYAEYVDKSYVPLTFSDSGEKRSAVITGDVSQISRVVVCDSEKFVYNEYNFEQFSDELSDGSYVSSLMTVSCISIEKPAFIIVSENFKGEVVDKKPCVSAFTVLPNSEVADDSVDFTQTISYGEGINVGSVQAYKVEGNAFTPIKTWKSAGEQNIAYISFCYSGDGKYVLLENEEASSSLSPVENIRVSSVKEEITDNTLSISFDDSNNSERVAGYKIYYSEKPITDTNSSDVHCKTTKPDKSSYTIYPGQNYGTVYLKVKVLGYDGSSSEFSECTYNYAPTDSDDDGIPDYWIEEHPGLIGIENIAHSDPDNDQVDTITEYMNGTDPLYPDVEFKEEGDLPEIEDPTVTDITDVVVAEELFDGFSAELMGAVADTMFNMKDSVDISNYEITTDDLVALFSAIAKYYPSEYSILSKTDFSYRASVSPTLGIVTKLRFFYDEDVNLSDYQRRVKELDSAINKIAEACEGMSDFEKALYVHDYILLHAEYDLELLEMIEAQGTLDGETHSERYSEYSILVNGTGVCGSYALAYRAVLNAMGINCLYLSSEQMNHAWNLVKLDGKWYHVDVCWDDPVPDTYGRARRTYFLLTDKEIMNLSHYSWTPGQYKATDTSFSDMPRDYDISQKMDNGNWYYSDFGSLYKADIYGKNEEEICTLSASTFDVDNGEIYFASGKYIYHHTDTGNSLVYVIPGNKLGSEPKRAYITNLYVNGNNAEYYKYIVDESGSGKIVNEKAEIGKEAYAGISGVCLNSNESTVSIFDTLQLTATATDGKSVAAYDCEWRSSNSNVASVSATGLVTARNVGTATVTFSALGFSAACRVTVTGDGLSGTCGENAVWEFDPETGTLTFSGDGEINTNTWSKCAGAVRKVAIKDDVYFSEKILNGFNAFTSLEAFDVSFWNDYYKDDSSAALLSKDKTELIKYAPANKAVYYEIPDDIIIIRVNALYGSENLQALVIPESVETVQTGSFSGCNNVKYLLLECGKTAAAAITPRFVNLKRVYVGDNSVDSLNLNNAKRITVYAEDSAQIKNFCSENGIKFVSTDTDNHAHGYYPKEFVDFTDEKDGEIKWYSFCGDDNYAETVHNYDEGEIIPATCISCEKIKRTCKNCGYVDISANGTNDYEVGDIIEFGSYPQTLVTDEAVISELSKDESEWISYNYYSGTGNIDDGQMTASDYMRYKDVSYNGNKYRAVTFDSYRPYLTGYTTSTSNTYQDDNGYTIGNVYWFKYEPIKWRVLDPSTGLIMCASAIDSQAYNNYVLRKDKIYGDSSCNYYASNYTQSSIRQWLNDDFYNTAFSSEQKSNIATTTLDNNSSRCSSSYDAPSTTDKIFLLSDADSINSNYGFSSDYSDWDIARQLKSTDYAKCQGCDSYLGNCLWWLRSPYYSYGARDIRHGGYSDNYIYVGYTGGGVVPALKLSNLKSDIFESSNLHSPAEHVTENAVDSTCKECGGYDSVTYCSLCGEELEREHISIPVSKHHCFETVETVEPTCTEDGYTKLVCSVCGEERTRTLSSVYAHDFIETVVAPTCTQNGYTKAECTLCGEVEFYDFTSPVGHKLMITNEGEFCENHGTKLYKCSRCDYEEAIAISNDNLVTETIRTEPTCTKAGSEKEICTICGATVSEKILSSVGHSFEEDYTIDRAATCTETGEKSRHCANCEERIFITEIPLAAHSFKDEIIISSCTKQGYTKHSCQNCEYSYCDGYTEINPSAHTIISDEAVAPTCTQTGLTAGSHCSECGITIVEQQMVNPTGHTAGEWEYEGNGYFIQKCDVCHETADSKQVSICFNVDSISVENGSTKALKPTVTDEFTTDYSFTSSDNSVATVDSDGKLTAKSVGKCNITVTINGTDISDTVPVNVNAREFSLTFVIDGKEQTEKVKEGTPIKTPENISKPGYIFKGWTPSVPPIMLDEDLIFTAVFEFDESVIETAKSELEKIKNDHVSDEAKAIINKAIEDIKEAFNPDTVYSIVDKAKTDAVTADKALVDSKTAANAELDTAKNNAKSDEAKSAIENGKNAVNTATSIDAVNTAKANAITAANNADAAYAEKTKFDKASINVASARTIDYRSIVTITATATDVPADCKLVLYVNGAKAAEGNNESVSHSVGELKSDINYTVKVVDKNGNVVKDSNGNELSKDSKITVNAGFFKKLIAFFKGLFKSLPKVEVKPQ